MHKYLRTGSGGHIGIDGNVCYDSIDKALQMSAAETDAALKGGAADRQKQIELTLLTMAAELKGEKK